VDYWAPSVVPCHTDDSEAPAAEAAAAAAVAARHQIVVGEVREYSVAGLLEQLEALLGEGLLEVLHHTDWGLPSGQGLGDQGRAFGVA